MRIIFLSLFFLLTIDSSLASGSYVGNGGDTIVCKETPENNFLGHYTLDYLLEFRDSSIGPIAINNFAETKTRLNLFLSSNYPELLDHFNHFMNAVRMDKPIFGRFWMAEPSGLIDIKDENIQKIIPTNCLTENNGELSLHLFQTVIRESITDPIRYHYDPQILSDLEKTNPLQYSFFIVHEWLWDLTHDVRSVRKLNWLFHSEQLLQMNRDDLAVMFNQLDVFKVKLSFCERSDQIKNLFKLACDQVSLRDLVELKSLVIHPENNSDFGFRMGDFYGFGRVEDLVLSNLKLKTYDLLPRLFFPLYTLKNLDLSHNEITSLSDQVAIDLKNLKTLNLGFNPLLRLPESFAMLESLEVLSLSVNEGNLFLEKENLNNLPPNLIELKLTASKKYSQSKLAELVKTIHTLRPKLLVTTLYDL